jgi:hypothetical protein
MFRSGFPAHCAFLPRKYLFLNGLLDFNGSVEKPVRCVAKKGSKRRLYMVFSASHRGLCSRAIPAVCGFGIVRFR